MIGARRLILRRGAAYLAAAFVAAPKGGGNAIASHGISPPQSTGPASVGSDPTYDERHKLAGIFYKQRRELEARSYMRYRAWNEQHPDLTVLQSTTPAWRATVMYDRISRERSIIDELEEKISAIWEKPFSAVTAMVAKWVRGDA